MKIELTKDEVKEIMTNYIVEKFSIEVSGKLLDAMDYYGGFRLEITDRFEGEKA